MAALAIVGGRVWDATRAAPLDGATVLIEDGRIVSIADAVPAAGVEQIDAGGRFVMPGLVDMHVHVQLCGEDSLYGFLGAGVTSVRDVGSDVEQSLPMRAALASGERVGPRLFVYGPLLDGDPPIFAGGLSSIAQLQATPAEGVANVTALIERGVDGLKLYAGLRPDVAGAMLEAVGGRVPVTGHLGRTWASEAAALGINCLEHVHATVYQDIARPEDRHTRDGGNGSMPNYWTWLTTGWANADLDADDVVSFIAQLVDRDVAISPTAVLATGGMATLEAHEEPGQRYRPRFMTDRMRERRRLVEQARAQGGAPAPPAVNPQVGAAALANELEFLRRFHAAGGLLLPSTDVGAAPVQVPGFSLHRELALLVRGGLANRDVLSAATLGAARSLRAEGDQGTLEPGRRADVLVIDGDPLEDIDATRNLVTVVKDGVAHDPAAILARIEVAEEEEPGPLGAPLTRPPRSV